MSPLPVFTFVALFLASLLQLVSCNDPNIGFEAFINTTEIQVYSTSDVQQFRGPGNTSDYEFLVPVTVTRRSSASQALTLTLFTRPYDYDEDRAPQEVQVYQQPVDMDGQQSYVTTVRFSLSTQSTSTTVYYLRSQLDIDENVGGNSTSYRSTVAGAVVLAYNSSSGAWIPAEPAEFAHQENVAVHAAYEAELAKVSEPPIDTTLDTVIGDQDPDLPEETDGTIANPPVENPQISDPPPCDSTTPSVPVPKPCEGPAPGCLSPGTYPVREKPLGESASPWTPKNGKYSPPSTLWGTPSRSPSPCPPPPPPPCPSALKHLPIHARQSTGGKGTLRLTLSYGTTAQPVPIRQLQVTAFGVVNQRVLHATGKTDNNGFVALQFALSPGETLGVYQVSASLDAEKFRVSTSKDGGKTFLFWRAVSVPLTWQIPVGTTQDFSYRFMNKATNDIFNVQDRMLTYWVFAKTKVYNFNAKLSHIWFPGKVGPNFFADPSSSGKSVDAAYINIHPDKAKFTSAQAHEYGHWFHYLARKQAKVQYDLVGEEHNFCQPGTANSAVVSLSEGYATAFGLSALWQSPFQEAKGTGYCWFPFDPAVANCLEIESYVCDDATGASARDLSFDEGRVAAVMRDLIDAATDDNGGDDDRGAAGFADGSNLARTRVLFDPMRANPTSMEEYWYAPPCERKIAPC